MAPIFFIFFILAAQFVMLNLVVAVLMKELGDAEKADAEEQAQLGGGEGESSPVEVIRPSVVNRENEEEDKNRRKSFDETMQDGKRYWKRRFSEAKRPGSRANVLFDFPQNDDLGKGVETIQVPEDSGNSRPQSETDHNHHKPSSSSQQLLPEDEALKELDEPIVPIQTGQTSKAPATPQSRPSSLTSSHNGEGDALPDRPPTRPAW